MCDISTKFKKLHITDIIIGSTYLTSGNNQFQSNKSMRYMKLIHALIFDSANLQRRFASTLLHSSSGRVGLVRSSSGPMLTSIIIGVNTTTNPAKAEHRRNPLLHERFRLISGVYL